jgi:DNA-binding Xre family transcriptional regulator
MDIFNKIERYITSKKISSNQLIRGIGLTSAGWYKMKKNNDIKLSTLENVCNYLNISLQDLMNSDLSEIGNISEQNLNKEYKKASSSTNNELIQKDLDHIKTLIKHIEHNL